MHAPRPRRWQRALRTTTGNHPLPTRQGPRALPYRCSFDKRSVGRGPCAPPPIIGNFLAMSLRGGLQGRRGPDINRRVCRTHVPYAFGCNPYPHALALPLGELSPKVTERACRGAGSAPLEPAGVDAGRRGRRPLQTATENSPVRCRAGPMSAHRRAASHPRKKGGRTDGLSALK